MNQRVIEISISLRSEHRYETGTTILETSIGSVTSLVVGLATRRPTSLVVGLATRRVKDARRTCYSLVVELATSPTTLLVSSPTNILHVSSPAVKKTNSGVVHMITTSDTLDDDSTEHPSLVVFEEYSVESSFFAGNHLIQWKTMPGQQFLDDSRDGDTSTLSKLPSTPDTSSSTNREHGTHRNHHADTCEIFVLLL